MVPNCGCVNVRSVSRRKNEAGNVYGELTVIEYTKSRGGEAYWLCGCKCGNLTEVRGSHLRGGSIQRCKVCGNTEAAKTKTTHGLSNTKGYKLLIARRRKNRAKALDNWTPEMEHLLRELFPACVLCGMTEDEHLVEYGTSLHLDHIRPLSLGHGLKPGNCTILCAKCNGTKQAKPLNKLDRITRHKLLSAAQEFNDAWTATF